MYMTYFITCLYVRDTHFNNKPKYIFFIFHFLHKAREKHSFLDIKLILYSRDLIFYFCLF